MNSEKGTLAKVIGAAGDTLTPKSKQIADYVMNNPQNAVFMTTRELAAEVGVSEATVVRFVRQLGYENYSTFIRCLRDHIDTGLTLMERSQISASDIENGNGQLNRVILNEIENLKLLSTHIDPSNAEEIITLLTEAPQLLVLGARLSFAPAYYMGWALTKVRPNISILKGSDRTAIDYITISPAGTIAVIVAMSRYPNELIRIGKYIRRQGIKLILLTDSDACPLIHFSNHHLIAPMMTIPFLGTPTALSCLINYLVHAVAKKRGDALKEHQEKLEQAFWENDILFNLESHSFVSKES